MADKKKKGRPLGRKDTVPVQARVSPEIGALLDKLVVRTRRSKAVELALALEEHLRRAGLLPPQPAPDKPDDE